MTHTTTKMPPLPPIGPNPVYKQYTKEEARAEESKYIRRARRLGMKKKPLNTDKKKRRDPTPQMVEAAARRYKILKYIKDKRVAVTNLELAQVMELDGDAVARYLRQLSDRDLAYNVERGLWRAVDDAKPDCDSIRMEEIE